MSRRTAIALILGLAAMQAAIPLAEILNEWFWRAYWSAAAVPWAFNNIGGVRSFSEIRRPLGDLTDTDLRILLFAFLKYLLPSLLFAIALHKRIRPIWFLLIGCLSPLILIGVGVTYFRFFPPINDSVHALLFGMLAGAFGAIALKLAQPMREPMLEDQPVPIEEGVARNPWRAWLILTLGFFLLQTAFMLSVLLTHLFWSLLVGLSPFWKRSIPYSNIVKEAMDPPDFVALRHAMYLLLRFLLPFLLLALAVYLRMRPRYGWLLGLLLCVVMAAENWIVQTSMAYYDAIRQVLFGQICGAMIVFLLWLYHGRVTKIQFHQPTDE